AEHEHADDVLAGAHDGLKAVDLRSAHVLAAQRLRVATGGERMKADWQPQLDRRFPQLVEHRMIVILFGRGRRGHHYALEAHVADLVKVLDRLVHRTHGRLADPVQARGRDAAELLQPAVVGPGTGVLQIGITDAADEHAYRGIQ